MPQIVNNLAQWLQETQGLVATGKTDKDFIEVQQPDGQLGRVSKEMLLKQLDEQGITDPKQGYALALNSADTPVDERAQGINWSELPAIGLGNTKGLVKYFQTRYGEGQVKLNDNGDIALLDKDGVWRKSDKSFLGSITDPRELSKDLVEALPDIASGLAIGGSALAGSVAGAGLASAGAAWAKTSLGRLAGTYDATPGEQLRDMTLEGVLGMAGALIPIGKKPTEELVRAAAKKIATSGEKNLATAAGMLESGTDASFHEATVALQNMDQLLPMAKAAWARGSQGAGQAEVDQLLASQAIKSMREAATHTDDVLHETYRKGLEEIAQKIPSKRLITNDILTTAEQSFEQPGVFIRGKDGAFRFATDSEAAKLGGAGTVPSERGHLQQMLNRLNAIQNADNLRGPAAANYMAKMERDLNSIYRNIYNSGSISQQTKMQAQALNNAFKKGMNQWFEGAGQAEAYTALKAPYLVAKDAVNNVIDANDNTLLDAIGRGSREGVQFAQDNFDKLASVGGNKTAQLLEQANRSNATRVVADWFNPFGWTPKPSLASKARDIYESVKGNPYAAARLAQRQQTAVKTAFGVNPKAALIEPSQMKQMLDAFGQFKFSLNELGSSGADALQSPDELRQSIQQVYTFPDQVNSMTNNLLQQSGAIK